MTSLFGQRLCALALAWAGSAVAQITVVLPDEPDVASWACLAPKGIDGSQIPYPKDELGWKVGGTVRVRMEFFDPHKPPHVNVLFSETSAFKAAVLERVGEYRLPCFKQASRPVVLTQEFRFDPRDGRRVTWTDPLAAPEAPGCELQGPTGSDMPYPRHALRNARTGSVLTQSRFDAPDRPPSDVKVLNSSYDELEQAAVWQMRDTRLACKDSSGKWPKTVLRLFRYRIEGTLAPVIKDVTLRQFLGVVDKLETHRVLFDLNSMACPFDLDLALYQPYAPNYVGEVGNSDPNRQTLLAWLRTVSLRIRPVTLKQVLGDTMRIAVPCGVVDLTS